MLEAAYFREQVFSVMNLRNKDILNEHASAPNDILKMAASKEISFDIDVLEQAK